MSKRSGWAERTYPAKETTQSDNDTKTAASLEGAVEKIRGILLEPGVFIEDCLLLD